MFLLANKLMKKLVEGQIKLVQSNSLNLDGCNLLNSESNFNRVSLIVYNICQFCFEEGHSRQTTKIKNNIQNFLVQNQLVIKEFIYYLFDLSFNVYKTPKIINKVSKTLFGLVVIDNNSFN